VKKTPGAVFQKQSGWVTGPRPQTCRLQGPRSLGTKCGPELGPFLCWEQADWRLTLGRWGRSTEGPEAEHQDGRSCCVAHRLVTRVGFFSMPFSSSVKGICPTYL
jgi:hypothetical protein